MKIYIGGSWKEVQRLQDWMEAMETHGHTITYDWTKDVIAEKADEECAIADRQGVRDADIIIVIISDIHVQRGTYIEMGIALQREIPVIMVGDREKMKTSVFTEFKKVTLCSSMKEVLEAIKTWSIICECDCPSGQHSGIIGIGCYNCSECKNTHIDVEREYGPKSIAA